MTIYLSAGHSTTDPGAIANGRREDDRINHHQETP